MTRAQPVRAAIWAWLTVAVGLVKSTTTSEASNSKEGSSPTEMPSGSAPARAPISCPRAIEPRRSVPPTTTMPGALISIFSSIWPIRPAQPTTPTLTAPLAGRLVLAGAGLGAGRGAGLAAGAAGPRGAAAAGADAAAGAGLAAGFAAGFSCDFKSIGFFCRALAPALTGGLAAALTAGLPAFFVIIPDPRESQKLTSDATVVGLTAKGHPVGG